ncbi:unnamed protein product [Brassicogethes aeneus]|uniref:Uncharacterized protein n=1 Tax=Brassicogethes aeneus TaxID=1431903 RepID=A0A9P0BAC6_BRAAE|nr:unnamed protein product [Brassicogethes aeneus]
MSTFEKYKDLKERLKRDEEEAYKKRNDEKELQKKRKMENKNKKKAVSIKIKLKAIHENDKNSPELSHNQNSQSNEELVDISLHRSTLEPNKINNELLTFSKVRSPTQKEGDIIQKRKTNKKSGLSTKALEEKRKKDRERQRRRRLKMSAEDLEKKQEYDKKYKERKIAEGTWKKLRSSMSKRERGKDRKIVRDRVRKCRQKQKENQQLQNFMENDTPPVSPQLPDDVLEIDEENSTPRLHHNSGSTHKLRGRKKKNLNRSKVYRLLKQTEDKLKKMTAQKEKYKKRYQRMKQKNPPSPNAKITLLAEGRPVPEGVRKRLLFTETVTQSLIQKRKEFAKTPKHLNLFHKIIASDIIKKRKLVKKAKPLISCRTFRKTNEGISRKWNYQTLSKQVGQNVVKFYEEDIHSKMLPGKKDCVTRKKIKKQKRLLLHSVKDLHTKYNATHRTKVSYTTFRNLKPYWVVHPKMSDRDTCACVKCSNIQLLANKAFQVGLVNGSVKDLIKTKVCDINNKDCMYQTCPECKNTSIIQNVNDINKNDSISYHQWQTVKVKRSQKDDTLVRVSRKNIVDSTKKEAIETLEFKLLPDYMTHQFKIFYQYQQLKNAKNSINNNEIFIHMDFSENYETKYHTEIQSMHFGSSKSHLSLHTVVVYVKENKKSIPKSYCTVSENTEHGAHAVWAHLAPIFSELQEKRRYDTVHMQSDGPASQYKNRFNMYFFTQITDHFKGIKKASWNFSVSGHGKGAADGVGGLVKRSADSAVKMGADVIDVKCFMDAVGSRTRSVQLFEIPFQKVIEIKNKIPNSVQKIPKITKLHQVTWTKDNPNTLFTRELSCFECSFDAVCGHHKLDKGYINLSPKTETKIQGYRAINENILDSSTLESNMEHPIFNPQQNIEGLGPKDWVLVLYEGETYPGQILDVNISNMEVTVNAMEPLPKNSTLFKWPLLKDIHTYPIQAVLRKINSPIQVDKRGIKYKFQDLPNSYQ